MNYFDLFQLPVSLLVDKAALKKKYFELSRRYHPDYFVQHQHAEQQQALDMSAVVNKAYKTFSNGDETIRYVLELKRLLTENEKYTLPPEFLMEMLELNEAVAEAAFDAGEQAKALQNIGQLEAELYAPVKPIVEAYEDGVTPEAQLLQVKDYYFKKKYLERLKEQLSEKL